MDDPLNPSSALPGSRAVLVVDDVGIVRRLAFRLLSEAGYRVFEAASATEALEVLEMARGRISVALVDVVMPEMSGVDLVRLISERWPGVRIVFMSAYSAEVLVREGMQTPSVVFLAKPFTREELLAKVMTALGTAGERAGSGEPRPRRPPRDG
jgi:CheY-like chemotaxis protein